jgi:hypothetical protein
MSLIHFISLIMSLRFPFLYLYKEKYKFIFINIRNLISEPADRLEESDDRLAESAAVPLWEEPVDWLTEPVVPSSAGQSEAPLVETDRPGQPTDVPVQPAAEREATARPREGENAPDERPGTSTGLSDASRRHNLDISLLARHIGKLGRIYC